MMKIINFLFLSSATISTGRFGCANADAQDIVLAAETASLQGAKTATNHAGYTGASFIDYGDQGSSAKWWVNIPSTETYEVTIRFASANKRGPMPLMVGGTKVGEFDIESTSNWTNWQDETIIVSLTAGNAQELELFAELKPGPNVDKITIKATDTKTDPPLDELNYKVVLGPNGSLARNEFIINDNGDYEVGLDVSGDLVVRAMGSSEVVWSLARTLGRSITGWNIYMQNDGNLVIRDVPTAGNSLGGAVWDSKTYYNPQAYFVIDDNGGIAVVLLFADKEVLWQGGRQLQSTPLTPAPTPVPTPVPAPVPTLATPAPIQVATAFPTSTPTKPMSGPSRMPRNMPSEIILIANSSLGRNEYIQSRNGIYSAGLNSNGNMVLLKSGNEVWRLQDKDKNDVVNIFKAYMQIDGNLVLRDSTGRSLWNSETSGNEGSDFRIDDGGQLSVVFQGTALWLDGVPRGKYFGPSSPDLIFPVRGMFYYAWYPETWVARGKEVFYTPNLAGIGEGFYKSGDPIVAQAHVKALDYAWVDLSIVSWWGPCDRLDRARITQLMEETLSQNSPIKWTVYYEDEKDHSKPVVDLVSDLDYLKKWFTWHKTWAHKEGKPVIFVWNEDGCEVADRWMRAASQAGWYVVLKLFSGYRDCPVQPDSWHQYGVSESYMEHEPYSFTIAPGFWHAADATPRHPRVGKEEFCRQVSLMKEKDSIQWHLVTTFNEWGEGTAVESATEWASASGMGQYLDCLHDPDNIG